MSRQEALKDWSGFAGSQYVARLAMLIRGIVVARLLGPEGYGKWLALLLLYDLGAYVHLGILNGMDREIPFWLGKSDEKRAGDFRDSGYTAVMGFTTLFLVALALVDLLGWRGYSPLTRFALPMVGVAVVLQNLAFLHYNVFRAKQRIGPISLAWVIQGVANLALSIPLVIYFGVYGLLTALVLTNVLTVFFLRGRADWRFSFRRRWDEMKRLFTRGVPVLAYLFVEVLLAQADKVVIIAALSRTELGYYGIAAVVAGLLRYVTSSASFTLFPKFISRFGETGKIESLARTLREPTFAFSIFIPVFLGLVYLWIHIPVKWVLPKFIPGVTAMRILVCGTVFFSLASLPSYFLISVNRTLVVVTAGYVIVALELGLNFLLVHLGLGIRGVALGAAVCQFLYGTVLLGCALRLVPEGERSVIRSVFGTYVPTLWVAAVIALLFRFLPLRETTLGADIGMGLVRGAILLVATAPLWVHLQRKTGVFTLAWSTIRKREEV
ncbi:MAG: oligosaccharide flippase family protein [Candidatus Eisenbacteria bacterium]